MDRIHLASKGIPRLINQLCDGALLASYADGRESVDIGTINEVCERENHRVSALAQDAAKESPTERKQSVSRRESVAEPASPATVKADTNAQAIHGLAKSIQECVETVIEGQGSSPAEIPTEVPDWEPTPEALAEPERPIREAPRKIAEMTERCRKAREELERLARGEFGDEPPAQTDRPDRLLLAGPGTPKVAERGDSGTPKAGRGRVAGLVDAVRQKCSRKAERTPLDRTAQSQSQPTAFEAEPPTVEVRGLANEGAERVTGQLPSGQAQAIDAINEQLKNREQVITTLSQHVSSQFRATSEAMEALEKRAATTVDLSTARAAHEAAMLDMESASWPRTRLL